MPYQARHADLLAALIPLRSEEPGVARALARRSAKKSNDTARVGWHAAAMRGEPGRGWFASYRNEDIHATLTAVILAAGGPPFSDAVTRSADED